MSTLSSLRSSLQNLQMRKSEIEDKLKIQRERRNDVIAITYSLIGVCDGSAGGISMKVNAVGSTLPEGANKNKNIRAISSNMPNETEKGCDSDPKTSAALSDLRSELGNVNKKISDLENELSDVRSRISSTVLAIIAEEERLAEERAREAAREAARALSDKINSVRGR